MLIKRRHCLISLDIIEKEEVVLALYLQELDVLHCH